MDGINTFTISELEKKRGEWNFTYNRRLQAISSAFCRHLDELERTHGGSALKVEFGKALWKKMKTQGFEAADLRLRTASLRYRMTSPAVNPNQEQVDALCEMVREWKTKHPQCTPKDRKKIEELCRYPKIAKVLIANAHWRDEFFKLVIRDNFPIPILVQFVHTCLELKQAHLASWVGLFRKFGRDLLTLDEEGGKKDVHFVINGKKVSILTDDEIDVGAKVKVIWKKLLEIGRRSSRHPSEISVFYDRGLMLWRAQGLYYADASVDIRQARWWKSAPRIDTRAARWWEDPRLPIFNIIDKHVLEGMLDLKIDPAKPYISAVSACCLNTRSVDDSHGYVTIYVPLPDGKYRVYPIGKYAEDFPVTFLEYLLFIANTVPAEMTYPDPSPGMSYRMQGAIPEQLTKEQAEKLFEMYGKLIWYFQLGGNNCSQDTQNFHNKVLGQEKDYYTMHAYEARTTSQALKVFRLMALFPRWIHRFLFHGFLFLLGSWRTLRNHATGETSSLFRHELFRKVHIFIPGYALEKIKTGEHKGVIYFGDDRLV